MEPFKNDESFQSWDLGFSTGISVILCGHVISPSEVHYIVATQAGEVKILDFDATNHGWLIKSEFDLTQNGAIWNMVLVDVNHDGIEEILIGGMNGLLLCLSGVGHVLWQVTFKSAITGIQLFPHKTSDPSLQESPWILAYSIDRTLRVINAHGHMVWAQMFAGTINCAAISSNTLDASLEIIAGSQDGTLRVFDGHTGKIKWFIEVGVGIRVVAVDENVIMIGDDSKRIALVDRTTHAIVQEKTLACYPWNLRRSLIDPHICYLSTYSFRYLGAENDEGIPILGRFNLQDLTCIWDLPDLNLQDFKVLQMQSEDQSDEYLLLGTSDGVFNVVSGKTGDFRDNKIPDRLPSVVNTICYSLLSTESSHQIWRIVVGCDDPKLFSKII